MDEDNVVKNMFLHFWLYANIGFGISCLNQTIPFSLFIYIFAPSLSGVTQLPLDSPFRNSPIFFDYIHVHLFCPQELSTMVSDQGFAHQ